MNQNENNDIMKDLMIFDVETPFHPIDEWVPTPADEVFKTSRDYVVMDVSSYYKMERNPSLDTFVMKSKRSYNNPDTREHIVHYLNYFERFYDVEKELYSIYAMMKYLIDCRADEYSAEAFIYDLSRYIMDGPISIKIDSLNRDNYSLNLMYKNVKNPNLQYSD